MNLVEIFSILLIHWFADFVLQTDKQARGKSKNWSDLLQHTFNYSLVWLFFGVISSIWFSQEYHILTGNKITYFFIITFVAHTITDCFTSRLNCKLYAKGDIHNFLVSVGFDQVLHYVQLFTTYYYLNKL